MISPVSSTIIVLLAPKSIPTARLRVETSPSLLILTQKQKHSQKQNTQYHTFVCVVVFPEVGANTHYMIVHIICSQDHLGF